METESRFIVNIEANIETQGYLWGVRKETKYLKYLVKATNKDEAERIAVSDMFLELGDANIKKHKFRNVSQVFPKDYIISVSGCYYETEGTNMSSYQKAKYVNKVYRLKCFSEESAINISEGRFLEEVSQTLSKAEKVAVSESSICSCNELPQT